MAMDMGMGAAALSNEPELNKRYAELMVVWRAEEACPEMMQWQG